MTALPASQPKPTKRRRLKTHCIRDYLQGVKSGLLKAQIRAAYRKRSGGRITQMNRKRREWVHDSIFETVNRLETREPNHPKVEPLFEAMNLVDNDLGWNDV